MGFVKGHCQECVFNESSTVYYSINLKSTISGKLRCNFANLYEKILLKMNNTYAKALSKNIFPVKKIIGIWLDICSLLIIFQ